MKRAAALAMGLIPSMVGFPLGAQESIGERPWCIGPALSADPMAILKAARFHPGKEDKGILVLLEKTKISIDDRHCQRMTVHSVFRIDQASALTTWSELSASWSPWHQERPMIRARVISQEGKVHPLDLSTLGEYSTGQSGGGSSKAGNVWLGLFPNWPWEPLWRSKRSSRISPHSSKRGHWEVSPSGRSCPCSKLV